MAARTVDGPDKDWLDMADLTHLTRLSENTIRRLIRAGKFPGPVEVTKGVRLWIWSDVVYWTLRKAMGSRLAESQEPPGSHQEAPTDEDGPSDS